VLNQYLVLNFPWQGLTFLDEIWYSKSKIFISSQWRSPGFWGQTPGSSVSWRTFKLCISRWVHNLFHLSLAFWEGANYISLLN